MQVSMYKYTAVSVASTLLGLIVIASAISTAHSSTPFQQRNCQSCPHGMCVNSPDECRFGYYIDNCHRVVCTKGPDEKCGGPYEYYGRCGHGLVCKCNQCVGCSTENMECSANNNPQC